MSNDRHTRFAAQLAEYTAAYVRAEANNDPLITIIRAEVSSNFSHATIFFTTIPTDREADALVFLKRSGSHLRHYLIKHMRVRHVPFLDFSVDYGERHRQHIDEIVRENGIESTFEEPKKVDADAQDTKEND